MVRIGLTGGIGSGKTALARLLSERQVPCLDLDVVGRALHSNADCMAELVDAFGNDIVDTTGAIDRRALAALCFADAGKTEILNHIMHPRIWAQAEAWCTQQDAPYVLIEASVLIESDAVSRMHAVVVVLADAAIRRQRVLASRQMDGVQFDAIVRRQCSDAQRRQVADFIVENNADLAALRCQADALHQQILAFVASRTA